MKTRDALDRYYTPKWATEALLERVRVVGPVVEPCVGIGNIASVLKRAGHVLSTNDIDKDVEAHTRLDATEKSYWTKNRRAAWVISNPPFSLAASIIPLAYNAALTGVAMLLRLSYLEPCQNRAYWLAEYPPTRLIVLPRISFTGDGKTDSVTCAWIVWYKDQRKLSQKIEIVTPAANSSLF